jgi:hypothetical protein
MYYCCGVGVVEWSGDWNGAFSPRPVVAQAFLTPLEWSTRRSSLAESGEGEPFCVGFFLNNQRAEKGF